MICKHCGYDVPDGIEYCTACGEPMPKPKKEETDDALFSGEKEPSSLTKKAFAKDYVPYSVRLSIHTGAFLSYVYIALSLYISIGVMILGEAGITDIILLVVSLVLGILTAGFQIKKSFICAVIITVVATMFTVYSLITAHQLTVIWVCAGVLGIYGTYHHNKLWDNYRNTGKLPPRIR